MTEEDQLYTIKDYKNELANFEKLVEIAVFYSDASGGIHTSNLGIEATKIYTRITLNTLTINSILPHNRATKSKLWDLASFAILTRSFMELCHRHLHFCEQNTSKADSEFSLNLYYYHMNSEKYKLYRELGASVETLQEFEEKLPLAKQRLADSEILKSMDKERKALILRGRTDIHLTDREIADKFKLGGGKFKATYRLLSNHTHGTPFATFSQSNERGRGFENSAEIFYFTILLKLLKQYISFAIVAQIELLS